MKWNQGTASTERFTLKNFRCQLFLWPLPVISDIPPNVDAAVLPTPLFLRPPENSKRKGTWAGSLYQGWQGYDRTGWKQEDSLGGLCLESVYPGWLASKRFLYIFYLMMWYMWHKMCFLEELERRVEEHALNCCSPSTLHSPCFSAPSGEPASPGFRQVPGPALQQRCAWDLRLAALPAAHQTRRTSPGGEPRAGSEKNMLSFFLLNKIIIICALIIWKRWCRCN